MGSSRDGYMLCGMNVFWFRRVLLVGFVLMASTALAQLPAVVKPGDQVPHGAEVLLWEEGAPGAVGTTVEDKPRLEFFGASPDAKLKDGLRTAVIVCPGSGYRTLAYDKEGMRIAEWLNVQGVSAFVLTYRLAPRYHYPAAIDDGQRAVRWVRAHAAEYGVSPNRIGVWGFSAGGHMVGILGTEFDAGKADAADPVERVSDRPDFAISSYGGLTLDPTIAKSDAMVWLIGEHASPELRAKMSPELHVTAASPPYFLYATSGDPTVPVLSTVVFYTALEKAGVPTEMHIFEQGPHGTALAERYPALSIWTTSLVNWMRLHDWLPPLR
jgi:acetyl esterase/lipase